MVGLVIVGAIVLLIMAAIFYGILTDPKRIYEEEDQEVDQESPQERHGFLRSHRFLTRESREDQFLEAGRGGTEPVDGTIND